ncbi:MAG: hypothetical protein MJZ02_04070 [Paludibacteraceae bacterium]|nr:hypothetical protein [Paludibacteraceae bacterium]
MRALLVILLSALSFLPAMAGCGDTYKRTSSIGTVGGQRLEMIMVRGSNSKGSNGMVVLICGIKDNHKYRASVEFRNRAGQKLVAVPITPRGGNNIDRHKDIVFFECYFKETELPVIKTDIDEIVVGDVIYKVTESGNRKLQSVIEKMETNYYFNEG